MNHSTGGPALSCSSRRLLGNLFDSGNAIKGNNRIRRLVSGSTYANIIVNRQGSSLTVTISIFSIGSAVHLVNQKIHRDQFFSIDAYGRHVTNGFCSIEFQVSEVLGNVSMTTVA